MADADPQLTLLDLAEPWREEWTGMPEFNQEDQTPAYQILVSFESLGDVEAFGKAIGQRVSPNMRGLWFPEAEITRLVDKRYAHAA